MDGCGDYLYLLEGVSIYFPLMLSLEQAVLTVLTIIKMDISKVSMFSTELTSYGSQTTIL